MPLPKTAPLSLSLLDAVKAETQRPGGRCTVARLADKLPADVLADLNRVLADVDIPATAIARGLGRLGFECGHFALQRHRRGSCGCPR